MNDYISRQDAIDALAELQGKASTKAELKGISKVWKRIKKLPSAQPEVIRCKDCKWKQGSECVRFADVRPFPDDYCSRAERKEA
jgi:hypothetical protein